MDTNEYYSLKDSVTSKIKVKGSIFIGNAFPVESRESAEIRIAGVVKQYHDATHAPFAYKLGFNDRAILRYNDDGEPPGTAGKPILEAIEKYNLTHVLVIVARYFGGVKLGKGGLSRAFRECAETAVQQAQFVKIYFTKNIRLEFPPELTGTITKVITEYDGRIISSDYKDNSVFIVKLKESNLEKFKDDLINETAAQCTIEEL